MTDLELKRRNLRESNQIQKTQEGMVSVIIIIGIHIMVVASLETTNKPAPIFINFTIRIIIRVIIMLIR